MAPGSPSRNPVLGGHLVLASEEAQGGCPASPLPPPSAPTPVTQRHSPQQLSPAPKTQLQGTHQGPSPPEGRTGTDPSAPGSGMGGRAGESGGHRHALCAHTGGWEQGRAARPPALTLSSLASISTTSVSTSSMVALQWIRQGGWGSACSQHQAAVFTSLRGGPPAAHSPQKGQEMEAGRGDHLPGRRKQHRDPGPASSAATQRPPQPQAGRGPVSWNAPSGVRLLWPWVEEVRQGPEDRERSWSPRAGAHTYGDRPPSCPAPNSLQGPELTLDPTGPPTSAWRLRPLEQTCVSWSPKHRMAAVSDPHTPTHT